MEEKTPLSHKIVCFQMLDFETSNSQKSNWHILVANYFFPENYITSEGAVSHNVKYYQQLIIKTFYANNYFE